jgi:hypothetical protein
MFLLDSTKLELIEGTWNTSGAILSTFDMAKNKGAFAYASSTSLSGKIFSVKFKVLSNAPVGDTEVKCILQLKDASGNSISVTNNTGKVSITCNHSFTKKTTDYLASPASCTSAAKYYYTCAVCDAKGTTTFTEGAPTAHSFDKQVATEEYLVSSVTCADTASYYYSCECGEIEKDPQHTFASDEIAAHTPGDWIIDKEAAPGVEGSRHNECTVCGATVYTEAIPALPAETTPPPASTGGCGSAVGFATLLFALVPAGIMILKKKD